MAGDASLRRDRELIPGCHRVPGESVSGRDHHAPYFPARWLAAASLLNGDALVGIKLRYFFWERKVWAILGIAGLLTTGLLLIRPDGRVHVYALDVGTGSAVLVRTAGGSQVLLDGGPDPDKLAQAIGRALPPSAREINLWIITGGRRQQIGAGMSVLHAFRSIG